MLTTNRLTIRGNQYLDSATSRGMTYASYTPQNKTHSTSYPAEPTHLGHSAQRSDSQNPEIT
jgi:hypothetical protein